MREAILGCKILFNIEFVDSYKNPLSTEDFLYTSYIKILLQQMLMI